MESNSGIATHRFTDDLFDHLHELYRYKDGKLIWKIGRYKNKRAGTASDRYRDIRIRGRVEKEHRIIYFMHYKELPEVVDHINRDKMDNRIENLRGASNSQNHLNCVMHSSNSSGYRGVSYMKGRNKPWRAYLKEIGLGYFYTPEEAAIARDKKAKEWFGEFAVLNFPDEVK